MSIPHKPLGIIKDLVEAVGLDVTYVYDDLIFIEHNAYLLQMEEAGEDVGVWFNAESTPADRPVVLTQLQEEGAKLSLNLYEKGTFAMKKQDDGETFQIELIGVEC